MQRSCTLPHHLYLAFLYQSTTQCIHSHLIWQLVLFCGIRSVSGPIQEYANWVIEFGAATRRIVGVCCLHEKDCCCPDHVILFLFSAQYMISVPSTNAIDKRLPPLLSSDIRENHDCTHTCNIIIINRFFQDCGNYQE